MFARHAIGAGEVVERYEETAYVLVSREYVRNQWQGLKRDWFDRYAWPVTNNIHATWSADPAGWRPVNHACDPNIWLEGLNVVARRDIAPGEQLTIDYATFCGPAMAPFECECGSPHCRAIIRGADCHSPELRQRYRGHLSISSATSHPRAITNSKQARAASHSSPAADSARAKSSPTRLARPLTHPVSLHPAVERHRTRHPRAGMSFATSITPAMQTLSSM